MILILILSVQCDYFYLKSYFEQIKNNIFQIFNSYIYIYRLSQEKSITLIVCLSISMTCCCSSASSRRCSTSISFMALSDCTARTYDSTLNNTPHLNGLLL